ncbi:hypothetical protein [Teichococcus vastitatis]|uniref:hypothetical protein n=1 Tax=Teichococcus vastitatis TaxID=2307076 RepID=UPI001300578A|nr:hypothetical protein [Pseudoroseomonas vastitatis]
MAISAQVMAVLDESGIRRVTADRYLRPQRAEGLIPRAQKGGGAAAPHFDAGQLAYVAIGLAAPEPIKSAETARILGNASFLTVYPYSQEQHEELQGQTLHGALISMIEGVAAFLMAQAEGKEPSGGRHLPHFIKFYLSPLTVQLDWIGRDYSVERREIYANNDRSNNDQVQFSQENSVIQRVTEIPGAFIFRLGELYYDSLLHQSGKLPINTDSMPVETPERKDAALPGAASMRTNQPSATPAGTTDNPEPNSGSEKSQPSSSRMAGPSNTIRRDEHGPAPGPYPVTP